MDDVNAAWGTLDDTERGQIATAIAGTNQREIFLSLMNNYTKALEYQEVALNSNGAAAEKYAIYQESLEAATNELRAAFEDLVYNSGVVGFMTDCIYLVTNFINVLNNLSDTISSDTVLKKFFGIDDTTTGGQIISNIFGGAEATLKGPLASLIYNIRQSADVLREFQDPIGESAKKYNEQISNVESEIETLTASISELQEKQAMGLATPNDLAILENYTEKLDDLNSKLTELQSKAKSDEYTLDWGDIEYTSSDSLFGSYSNRLTASNFQKELEKIQQRINQANAKILSSQTNASMGLTGPEYTLTDEELNKERENIRSMEQARDSILETASAYGELIRKRKENGEVLSDSEESVLAWLDANKALVEQYANINTSLSEQNGIIESSAESYVDLTTSLNAISVVYNEVSAAIEEFDANGHISQQTAATLISTNEAYADAISVVNGQIVINRDMLLQLTEAERQRQIAMAEASQANIKSALDEKQAVLDAILAQIEGYKLLATTRELTKSELNIWGSYRKSADRVSEEVANLEKQYDSIGLEIEILKAKNYDLAASNGAVENSVDSLRDSYQWFIGKIQDQIDDEIDALQDEKDYWNDYYDDKIDGIQDMIDALDEQKETEDKLLAIEEARANLAKANQEVVRIYRRNQGFVYEKNMEAVAEAQDELNILLKEWDQYQQRLELEQQVEDFENAKDATIEDIDEEIEKLQDLKDQWGDALDIEDEVGEYSEWLDELAKFEDASYEERLEMLADFVASWNAKVSQMKSASSGGGGGGGSRNPSTGRPTDDWNFTKVPIKTASDTGKGQKYDNVFSSMGRQASGTKSITEPSLNLVGEEGPELRVLNRGDAILKNSLTENLMEWGRFSPFSLLSKLPQFTQNEKTGNVFQFSFDNLTLPNVNNADTFVEELKTKSMRMAIQIQSQRA